MCKYHNKQNLDKCMKPLIKALNREGYKTLACCCGHGKYYMTIVMYDKGRLLNFDFISGKVLYKKKRFYKKDKQGYYYIPEVQNAISK